MAYLILLVPVAWLFWALYVLLRSVFRLIHSTRMNSTGIRVPGRVVSVTKRQYQTRWMGSRITRTVHYRETLEFPGPDGRRITGRTFFSDVDDVDRTGQEVLVIADRSNPQRFSAPLDGQNISIREPRAQLFTSITMVIIDTALFFTMLVMIHMARSGTLPGMS